MDGATRRGLEAAAFEVEDNREEIGLDLMLEFRFRVRIPGRLCSGCGLWSGVPASGPVAKTCLLRIVECL